MQLTRRFVPIGLIALIAACADPSGPDKAPREITALPRALSPAELAIIDATGTFAFDLLREVNEMWQSKNVFISPLSASMALGMTMNGASGTTLDQMRQALGLGAQPLPEINAGYRDLVALLQGLDAKVQFEVANAIWYDRPYSPSVEPSFLADARTWFDAEAGPLDFGTPQSVTTINDWAKEHTNGKIDRVIETTSGLVMLLANAIYFKGDWRDQFEKSRTQPAPFTISDGSRIDVPTMEREGTVRYGRMSKATVLEMPYGGNAFAMTILLPDEGVGIDAFVAGLSENTWNAGTSEFREAEGEVQMPRFTLKWKDFLNDPLKRLGMVAAFTPAADFSRLARTPLYVSFVRQDAFVDVNEEGTEAAAVTTVGLERSVSAGPLIVHVNRPFVFAIRERLSGTILFLGKIVDPR